VRVVRTIDEARATRLPGIVGLVPTMGALHAGHVSLFEAAREECDTVVATIFVNRAQFAPTEDFTRYPRDEAQDARLAEEEGVDVLFVPEHDELYRPGHQTWVDVEQLGSVLEGAFRPGHFRGVATVCLKLFNIVRPQLAYFGQKDAQQAAVLRRMVRDLNLELDLRVLPTVRDTDGLALSSRNVYLSDAERAHALALPRALATSDPSRARELLEAEPGLETDYVEVLEDNGSRTLTAAVRVGATRLIDNVPLEGGHA
jgi:pantoate--beta-alanine ligase